MTGADIVDDRITPPEAARILGVDRTAVVGLMGRGVLRSYRLAGHRYLSRAEVEAHAAGGRFGLRA
jgi:excisionase family DNA binding protein